MFGWLRRLAVQIRLYLHCKKKQLEIEEGREKFEVRTAPAPKGREPKTPQPPREHYAHLKPIYVRGKFKPRTAHEKRLWKPKTKPEEED